MMKNAPRSPELLRTRKRHTKRIGWPHIYLPGYIDLSRHGLWNEICGAGSFAATSRSPGVAPAHAGRTPAAALDGRW